MPGCLHAALCTDHPEAGHDRLLAELPPVPAAVDLPPQLPAPRRRAVAASFFLGRPLAKQENNNMPFVPYDKENWYGPRPGVTGSAWLNEEASLGPVQVRLLYQTPEVYATDIHVPAKLGFFKYGCKMPPKETYKNGLGEPMPQHPWIALNTKSKKVHVHLVDTTTGQVFWDADFKTSALLFGKGRKQIAPSARPEGFDLKSGRGVFRAPCVEADDPDPHYFELSIQGKDGVFDDQATSWGSAQGVDKMDGKKAYIGISVRRTPRLEETTLGEPSLMDGGPYRRRYRATGVPQGRQVREFLGQWKAGGSFGGEVHPDPYERWLKGEQGLNMPSKPGLPPEDDRFYYDDTFDRSKRDWSYWTWLGPPNGQNMPVGMDYSFTTGIPSEKG